MSFFNHLFKRAAEYAADNAPALLMAIGVVGTVSTAYLVGRASFQVGVAVGAHNEEAYSHNADGVTNAKELVEFVRDRELWKAYIPAVVTCAATVTCIIGANHIGSKRAAGMAAAYSVLEKGANEYQAKVVEKFGERKAEEIRSDILADRLRENDPFEDNSIEVYGKPDAHTSTFLDKFSGLHVWTNREEIGAAMNDIGRTIIHQGYATLADFYYRMDMPSPAYASEIGWSSDDELPRPVYSSALTPGNLPVNAFDFSVAPNPRYLRFR